MVRGLRGRLRSASGVSASAVEATLLDFCGCEEYVGECPERVGLQDGDAGSMVVGAPWLPMRYEHSPGSTHTVSPVGHNLFSLPVNSNPADFAARRTGEDPSSMHRKAEPFKGWSSYQWVL